MINGYLRRIWGSKWVDKVLQLEKGVYMVRFLIMEAREDVMKKDMLQFDNKPLNVYRWSEDFHLDKASISKVQV